MNNYLDDAFFERNASITVVEMTKESTKTVTLDFKNTEERLYFINLNIKDENLFKYELYDLATQVYINDSDSGIQISKIILIKPLI